MSASPQRADAPERALTRRQLISAAGALGALGVLNGIGTPWPASRLAAALAADPGLSPAALKTFTAAVEAICSFDDRRPPPSHVRGRGQPVAGDVASDFSAEYSQQLPGFQQGVGFVLQLVEQAPRTPPPMGAVDAADLAAYGGRSFSALDVPLRLRLLRSWQGDGNTTPLAPPLAELTGIPDYGTLHRGIAYGATQLATLSYYFDHRTWRSVGWKGPWLGRRHEREELPLSHHGHGRYTVHFGGGVWG